VGFFLALFIGEVPAGRNMLEHGSPEAPIQLP
jgi:hypothetical protein